MREYLSFINSSLLVLLVLTIGTFVLTDKGLPPVAKFQAVPSDLVLDSETKVDVPGAQIYGRRDIFDLYEYSKMSAVKTVMVKNIPQLTLPPDDPIPDKPTTDFIDPLEIKLNGIVFSLDQYSSMCILADETGKEKVYKFGDKIRDGIIISILRDRVVVLRNNGQQEVFFLKEVDESEFDPDFSELFEKTSENHYVLDISRFSNKVPSLGSLLEQLDIAPLMSSDDTEMLGLFIDRAQDDSLATAAGLQSEDVIISINGNGLGSKADRIRAYDDVIDADQVVLSVERNKQIIELTYDLTKKMSAKSFIEKREMSPEEASLRSKLAPANKATVSEKPQDKQVSPSSSSSGKLSEDSANKNRARYQKNIEKIRQDLMNKMRGRAR